MCSIRILCRLRFISNSRKEPRQPIKELLEEAIYYFRQLEGKKVQDSKLSVSTLFEERAKEVIKLVDT
jgi:DNA-binding protein Fis